MYSVSTLCGFTFSCSFPFCRISDSIYDCGYPFRSFIGFLDKQMTTRLSYKIKEWAGMGFGDSLGAAGAGRMERYCCNVICGAPRTSKVKGLR